MPKKSPQKAASQKIRFVTATSLFDGHDASINIFRRLLQRATTFESEDQREYHTRSN